MLIGIMIGGTLILAMLNDIMLSGIIIMLNVNNLSVVPFYSYTEML
jgi:hypothetical protein